MRIFFTIAKKRPFVRVAQQHVTQIQHLVDLNFGGSRDSSLGFVGPYVFLKTNWELTENTKVL